MTRLSLCLALVLAPAFAAGADEVSDALQAAADAYSAGKLRDAGTELAKANAALSAKRAELIVAIFPPAPDGWTREDSPDFAAGLAMMGGGTGAEVRYVNAEGYSFNLNVLSDNPLALSMVGMFANEVTMAMMGKVVDGNGAKIIDQDGSLMALVDNRLLVQASGMSSAEMLPIVQQIDFNALAAYDQ